MLTKFNYSSILGYKYKINDNWYSPNEDLQNNTYKISRSEILNSSNEKYNYIQVLNASNFDIIDLYTFCFDGKVYLNRTINYKGTFTPEDEVLISTDGIESQWISNFTLNERSGNSQKINYSRYN
ncbi:MAG: hypothetical protein GF329_11160, partial [Candidatus Lokiarchaeota archaeon]|nr:hypothetical protein [Candidatus Lokiarchaeota archaeon]